MRRICLAALTVLLIAANTACAAQGEQTESNPGSLPSASVSSPEKSESEQTETAEAPNALTIQTIEKTLSSGVIIDAQARTPGDMQSTGLPEMKARARELDFELIKAALCAEKNIVQEGQEATADSMFFLNAVRSQLATEDGYVLSSTGENILWAPTDYEIINDLMSENPTNVPLGDNRAVYETGEALEFASIEEADAEIREVAQRIGLSVFEPTCYTLSLSALQAQAERYNAVIREGNEQILRGIDVGDGEIVTDPEVLAPYLREEISVSEADERYVLTYPIAVNDMPLADFDSGSYGDGSFMVGTYLRVTYSRDGIHSLELPYALDVTDTGTPQPVLTLDEALQKLDDKYNSIILEGEYYVDDIRMAYVPIRTEEQAVVRLVPAWRFQTNHAIQLAAKDGSGNAAEYVETSYVLFNALDGTEMVHENGSI